MLKKTLVPMARIERATSPLPRECSTTEPHGPIFCPTFLSDRHWFAFFTRKPLATSLERETGIEPASLAWKARVLPLNYSRSGAPFSPVPSRGLHTLEFVPLWWRRLDSNQRRRKPTDLQSAPFSHSGTPPKRTAEYNSLFGGGANPACAEGGDQRRPASNARPKAPAEADTPLQAAETRSDPGEHGVSRSSAQ